MTATSRSTRPALTGGSTLTTQARPLLKWAGGKRQLLPVLRRLYPPRFGRYVEPFAGSAAVFFDLHACGRLARGALLIDRNADLIGCYEAVRDDPDAVLRELERLAEGHARGGSTHYYSIREAFNQLRQRGPAARTESARCAAMLMYLNRTGYNGLFRLNASGLFNVPAGRYTRPRIHDPALLRSVSAVLRSPGVALRVGTFDDVLADAERDDFIYFDPPYAPLSTTAAFNTYTAAGFGAAEQEQLCRAIVALQARGCHVVASNSSAPIVLELYGHAARSSGGALQLWAVPARRAINSRGERRGDVREVVLTSVHATWTGTVAAERLA